MKSFFVAAQLCLCAVLTSGCFGSSAATHFYMLSSSTVPEAVPEETSAEISARVAVGPVTVAQYLSRDEMVVRGTDHTVKVLDFDHWVEPLDRAIPQVLSDKMASDLATVHALVYPSGSSEEANFQVAVEIERFDVSLADKAVLAALWVVRNKAGERVVPRTRTVLSLAVESDDKEAMVATLNKLVQELGAVISAKLETLIKHK